MVEQIIPKENKCNNSTPSSFIAENVCINVNDTRRGRDKVFSDLALLYSTSQITC